MPLILLCVLLLTACATNPQHDVISSAQVTRIEVPVSRACLMPEQVPEVPKVTVPENADVGQRANAIGAYVIALRNYADVADPLLKQCSKGEEK